MSGNEKPLVSILTPSFNQGVWLEDNLRSVQNQTHKNIEHIVMDGGSTDNTIEVLKNAPANVMWTSEPDRGQSHALNKAFAASHGDIIGWINSDDAFVDRRAVEAAVAVFRNEPSVGVVYGHGIYVDERNRFLRVYRVPKFSNYLLDRAVMFLQPSVFFRRSILKSPFVREEVHYCMDLDLFLRLRARGAEFRRIPYVISLDRFQPARKSFDVGDLSSDVARVLLENGVEHGAREKSERRLLSFLKVFTGIGLAAGLSSSVQPAIDLDLLTNGDRVLNQSIRRMRHIYGQTESKG